MNIQFITNKMTSKSMCLSGKQTNSTLHFRDTESYTHAVTLL